MNRLANGLLALCFVAGLTACGGGLSGFVIPVESELKPWVAPETDELVVPDQAADDDDEDYEDYEDEEGDEAAAAPAPVPTTPATPVAK